MPNKTAYAKKILVADDDANDIFFLQRAFANAHVSVNMTCVRDGDEAIDFLHAATIGRHALPELFFLDLKMPRVGGFSVLEWVRGQPGLKRLPIIVLTSSDEPEDINRAYDLGANSYLVKPGSNDYLGDIVQCLHDYWMNINHNPDCTRVECDKLGF